MLNLLYSGNRAIFDGMLISVLSLVKFNPQPINVYVLTMDLSNQDASFQPISTQQIAFLRKLLQDTNPASTCTLFDMTQCYLADNQISIGKRFTPYALLRLYATQIDTLPDKILYLDTDTLILGSLAELFATDISNYEFAAVKDYFGKIFISHDQCNSGVLLLNIPKIKATRLFERVRQMCITKNLFLADQTALNKCATSKLFLPPKYNRQRRINKDTIIRHYCASWRFFPVVHVKTVKPWEVDKILKDKRHVYNNATVTEILTAYQKIKQQGLA